MKQLPQCRKNEINKLKTAKAMLKENIPIETIIKITELSREKIEKLNTTK